MNNEGLNNKGFTLVELLAVILILLSISVVAIINVSASLRRNNDQVLETQKKITITAAKLYFLNNDKMTVNSSVKIDDLITAGYLEAKKVDKLSTNYYIVLCSTGYIYKSGTSC